MRMIKVEDAVGCVCCHDFTKIVPGEYKGAAFKKGHKIREQDIPELIKMGKEHIYVWEDQPGRIHENDAAIRLAKTVMGSGLDYTKPAEGKVQLVAQYDGLCCIQENLLIQVNQVQDVMIATRSNVRHVKKGDIIAGLKAIPLFIDEACLEQVEEICCNEKVVSVKPFRSLQAGVVTTGNEVYSGLIQDQFGPFLQNKLNSYGCKPILQQFVQDDASQISQAILNMVEKGADFILTTGGMSVDPDDVTPTGIKQSGAEIVTYGVPVLPGAMMLVAYLGDIPILGLPGGVMYSRVSAFDLLLPLILTDQKITRESVAKLGLGGLCLNCPTCHFPSCTFGTGA